MSTDVTSREYKIMLKANLFNGSENDLIQATKDFWDDLKVSIPNTTGTPAITKKRLIRFFDTTNNKLKDDNNYVFRERVDLLNNNQREVTLKYRHPDRFLSQDRNMDAFTPSDGETKFEEDIKPDFQSMYSYSTTQEISSSKNLNKMNDPVGLYPGLEDELDSYDSTEAISKVNGFTANEKVLKDFYFKVRNSPEVLAKCSVTAWYDDDGSSTEPVVVEFSFKYLASNEDYTGKMAKKAIVAYDAVKDLSSWIDNNSLTKTAYVYSL